MKKGLDVVNLAKGIRIDFPGVGTVVIIPNEDNGKIGIGALNHLTGDEYNGELNMHLVHNP